jgi:DNA-binding MarR family transcriptional regulator
MTLIDHQRHFPSSQELFLMAMIRNGPAASVYDLREQGGINPGAIAHALKRLERRGAIERPPEGYRRKRPLRVTPAGIDILENQWKSLLAEPVEDMYALTRLAGLTMLMGFRKMPARLVAQADRLERSADNPGSPQLDSEGSIPNIEFYRWMKQNARFHEVRAMAAALRDFAREGESLLPHEPD